MSVKRKEDEDPNPAHKRQHANSKVFIPISLPIDFTKNGHEITGKCSRPCPSRLYLDQTSLPHKFDTFHSCIIPRRTSILLYAPARAWAASRSGKLACPSLDFFSTSPLSIDLPSLFFRSMDWKVTRAEEISAEECHENLSPLMSGSRPFIRRIEQE